MNPKKAKELIPYVAKKLSVSEVLITDVVSFYWEEVRKSLSNLKHSRIHITNLGDFIIKNWKIDDKVKQLEQWENNNKQKGLQQITARFKTAETLFALKDVKKIIEEEQQRKEFIKLHKNESNKEYTTNLEE